MKKFLDKYSTFNFWLATFYAVLALLGPHTNTDAILILLSMVFYYCWAKEDLKLA